MKESAENLCQMRALTTVLFINPNLQLEIY